MAQTPERRVTLEMDNITKTFPGVKALSDVTFDVREHEIHAICGENGAGKSTLMKVLSGVHPHGSYSGRIVVEGKEASYKNVKDSEKDGIVVIQQELALSPHLSIAENIFLGNERSNHGVIDWDRTKAEAKALMTKVGLNEKPETIVSNIGVGKQQLVEIAKALGKDVKVLILDEPTAALNDDSQKLLDLIVGLKESGISCVIISHKLSEIRQVADRVTVIRDGQTITTHDMHGDVEVTEGLLIRDMVGRSMDNRFPDHVSKIGEEVMRVENWAVTSPITGRRALHDVSFNVRAGEIVGIAGLMGAGRTELAMSLFGKSWGIYEHGDLYLHDKKVALNSVRQAINAGIAYASEDRKRYGLNLIGAWQGFWVVFVGIPGFIVTLAGMLLFRGLAIVMVPQTIAPLPSGFVKIANGGILGWFGFAGVLDVFTLVVGVLLAAMFVFSQLRRRASLIKHGLEPEPMWLAITKMVVIVAFILVFTYILAGAAIGFPFVLVICGVLVVVYTFVLNKTTFGRYIYAVGGNREAARLSGISVESVNFWMFVNMGFLAAIGAIVTTSRAGAAVSAAGQNYEMDVIAACFIGGAAVWGGIGRISGTIIGALFMGVLNMGLSIMSVDSAWQQAIKGLVLLGAVAFDQLNKSRAARTV